MATSDSKAEPLEMALASTEDLFAFGTSGGIINAIQLPLSIDSTVLLTPTADDTFAWLFPTTSAEISFARTLSIEEPEERSHLTPNSGHSFARYEGSLHFRSFSHIAGSSSDPVMDDDQFEPSTRRAVKHAPLFSSNASSPAQVTDNVVQPGVNVLEPTADRTPTITGIGTPGDALTIVFEATGEVVSALVNATGHWNATPDEALPEGSNGFTVQASSSAGSRSEVTFGEVVIDTTPPDDPTIDALASTTDPTPFVSGSGTPGDALAIMLTATQEVLHVIVDETGRWQASPSQVLPDGHNSLTIQASDAAGNLSHAVSTDFIVDTTSPATIAFSLTTNAQFVTAWSENGASIYAQTQDASGNFINTNFQLDSGVGAVAPKLAALANGGFVAVWTGYDSTSVGISGQVFDPAGNSKGPQLSVNSQELGHQFAPQVTSLRDGGFVITWTSNVEGDGSFGIYGRRYTADGNAAGLEFKINTQVNGDQEHSGVAGLSDGGFLVVWMSEAQDGSGRGIFSQRYSANGVASGPETQINLNSDGDQFIPSVAGTPGGGFIVTWASNGNEPGIIAQRFDSEGSRIGSEIHVSSAPYATALQTDPSVTTFRNGDFLVAWTTYQEANSANGSDVFARRFDAQGNAMGEEFRVNSYTLEDEHLPSVAVMDDDSYIISWIGQDASGEGIFAQRFDNGDHAIGNEYRVNDLTAGDESSPSIVSLKNDLSDLLLDATEAQDGASLILRVPTTRLASGDQIDVSWGTQVVSHILISEDISHHQIAIEIPQAVINAAGDGPVEIKVSSVDPLGNRSPWSTSQTVFVATKTHSGGGDDSLVSSPSSSDNFVFHLQTGNGHDHVIGFQSGYDVLRFEDVFDGPGDDLADLIDSIDNIHQTANDLQIDFKNGSLIIFEDHAADQLLIFAAAPADIYQSLDHLSGDIARISINT